MIRSLLSGILLALIAFSFVAPVSATSEPVLHGRYTGTVSGQNVEVTFFPDKTFQARICNQLNGTYSFDGATTVKIYPGSSTRMLCEKFSDLEAAFQKGFSLSDTNDRKGIILTFSDKTTLTLALAKFQTSVENLSGTEWKITDGAETITLKFTKQKVTIIHPCGTWRTNYRVRNGKVIGMDEKVDILRISSFGRTREYCTKPHDLLEGFLTAATKKGYIVNTAYGVDTMLITSIGTAGVPDVAIQLTPERIK